MELSLTLILAGLITSLALPAFAQWGDRLEQEQFMELFSEDIRLAQREASVREEVTFLQVDTKGGVYSIHRGEERLREEKVPARYRLESNYPSHRLVFQPSGQARGGTFRLKKNGKTVGRIVVQVASGRPRVEVVP
ncbi:GspH/FimT family pseudopilin [Kroppenstedtia sanguinis]|uniref:GspH/FimT family pseudopilin n=1 Tax=Kroppenstedtia sanguinis TaxID=1380684 RepID=UPI0036D2FF89